MRRRIHGLHCHVGDERHLVQLLPDEVQRHFDLLDDGAFPPLPVFAVDVREPLERALLVDGTLASLYVAAVGLVLVRVFGNWLETGGGTT